jgi:arabinose-5-phosphate isomerase
MNSKPAQVETMKDEDISNAIRVFETEIDGLNALKSSLDASFSQSIKIIDEMKNKTQGRLIIAGIGKSGHISRKIAATLASTGTPSYFVHPGEASHGDLGMITKNDVVLMISNSGENNELSDLIAYTRRFKINLIAMTSNASSTLASHADVVLLLPKVPEACPNGLAPTTSTTMMIALGDALAVALLERSGLTAEQFKVFHPGGKLGQKLVSIKDLMHKADDLPLVNETTLMDEALLILTEKNLGCVIVTDETKELKGIITDGDLKRHMGPDLLTKSVKEIMTTNPKTIESKSLAVEAMEVMTRTPGQYLTSLIVLDDNKISGLIRLQDCLQAGVA